MKVTPVGRKFGKYSPGDEFELPDKTAKVLVRLGKLAVSSAPVYQTRMMQAEAAPVVVAVLEEDAPYGFKADGTPRKRPGRPAASEE